MVGPAVAAVKDVQFELLLAVALVVLVIFLFLRNLPATIIPSVTVPLALWQGRALLATPAGQLPALAWRWRGVGVFVLWVLIVIAGRWIAYS